MKGQNSIQHPMAYMPLKLCLGYLAITMIIAFWGPIKYYQFPIEKTFVFMISVMISISVGFVAGIRSRINEVGFVSYKNVRFFRSLFRVCLSISLASLFLLIIQGVLQGSLNTDLSGIGDAYIDGYSYLDSGGRNSGSYSISFIIFTFTYPLSFICFTMGLFYFDSISKIERVFFLAYIVFYILYYVIGSGKMKYLGDLMIYSLAVMAVRHGCRGKPLSWKMVVSGAMALMAGGVALLAVLGQRYEALGFSAANANVRINQLIYFDLQHPIFKILGENVGLNLALLLSYASQGYYGLGLALETNWEWTRFQGFSYSVSVLCNQILGFDWAWPHTLVYQVGVQWGWGESKWHTVFTHFATDFTFPGTVVLFGIFSYIYARSWIKAVKFRNPASILMFVMLSMGMFFMPANNQLLHAPSGLLLVLLISIIYIKFDRAFNIKNPGIVQESGQTATLLPQVSA